MVVEYPATIYIEEIGIDQARKLAAGAESAVGHTDTAAVFSAVLGVPVAPNRVTISLKRGEEILVGQYRGPRLPEGCKTLPEGAAIQWLLAKIN